VRLLLDAFAWVEYFLGSDRGAKVQALVHRPGVDSLTLESNLAEVKGWCLRERLRFDDYHGVIRARSRVVPLSQNDWLRAIEIRHELRRNRPTFGLIDALLLAKREASKGTVVSGDPHFRGLPRVVTI